MTPRAWYDPSEFPELLYLGQFWKDMLDELTQAVNLLPWVDRSLYGGSWDVFGLYDLPDIKPVRKNIEQCPITTGLINRVIPDHGTVAFSVLGPKSRIFPHTAHPSPYARAHLGLRVPEGDCQMWVSGTARSWQEGEWLVFNEHLNHSAWNKTAFARIVLIVDVPLV